MQGAGDAGRTVPTFQARASHHDLLARASAFIACAKAKRGSVDAIPRSPAVPHLDVGRWDGSVARLLHERAVSKEDVAEMSSARITVDLDTPVSLAIVADGAITGAPPERWPASSRFKLGCRVK